MKKDWLVMALLFIVAALPRLTHLGQFLTADEKNWMGRSHAFVQAFVHGNFNDMLQTTHPGVTTLWVSGLSVLAKSTLRHQLLSFDHLIIFIRTAQFPIALLNALAIPAVYYLLRRLMPQRRAVVILATLLIALDPFFIGYSRVVHVDALLTSFMFLAALAMMLYAQTGFSRRWLIISAVLTTLTLLTKIPALFLLPFFVLIVLVYAPVGQRWQTLKSRWRDMWLGAIIIIVLSVMLWPALLFVADPQGNILTIERDVGQATSTPHNMIEAYTLNAWHYPAALLVRTTPVTLVFASLFIIWLMATRNKNKVSWLLVSYVFFFVVMMTLGAKKGDRYILPVWPALDTLAALGIAQVALVIGDRLFKGRHYLMQVIAGAAAVMYVAFVVFQYHPYAIAYHNPLFPPNLSQELGWGEGLEQVAEWFNHNHPTAIVASWYPEELGAYTSAHVAHINAHEQPTVQYVVLYRNMFGRAPDHYANDFIDEYYKKREAVFIAHVAGLEYAWVYEQHVYERVIGELGPDIHVGQLVSLAHDQFDGFDLRLATYFGQAKTGDLVVDLKSADGRTLIHEWRLPIKDIKNDRWQTFTLPTSITKLDQSVLIDISTDGASGQKAPTIRYTRDRNYRPTELLYSASGTLKPTDTAQGDLAVRLRYLANGQSVTQDETKLLPP